MLLLFTFSVSNGNIFLSGLIFVRVSRYPINALSVMKKRAYFLVFLFLSICALSTMLLACKKNSGNTENAMPTAVFSADTTRGDTSTVFLFDASHSTDREDPVSALLAAWNFGDNNTGFTALSAQKTITHVYKYMGVYTAKLVVMDSQGLSDTVEQMIVIVSNILNRPPGKPVYTSPDNYSTLIPSSVKLSWLCTDPENDPLTYDVFLGYDPTILYRIKSGITASEFTVTSLDKGSNYFWQIAAHDPNGNYVPGDVWRFSTAP
jgi:PKD repeat protein